MKKHILFNFILNLKIKFILIKTLKKLIIML